MKNINVYIEVLWASDKAYAIALMWHTLLVRHVYGIDVAYIVESSSPISCLYGRHHPMCHANLIGLNGIYH